MEVVMFPYMFLRSVSSSADEGASTATGAGAWALGWNRKVTHTRTHTVRSELNISVRGLFK
jgi:hypothetical protein